MMRWRTEAAAADPGPRDGDEVPGLVAAREAQVGVEERALPVLRLSEPGQLVAVAAGRQRSRCGELAPAPGTARWSRPQRPPDWRAERSRAAGRPGPAGAAGGGALPGSRGDPGRACYAAAGVRRRQGRSGPGSRAPAAGVRRPRWRAGARMPSAGSVPRCPRPARAPVPSRAQARCVGTPRERRIDALARGAARGWPSPRCAVAASTTSRPPGGRRPARQRPAGRHRAARRSRYA